MFYYYGRKKKMAPHYPAPQFDTIVEPFAGGAAYSLHDDHWQRKVILIERDPFVARVWWWLITASDADVAERLPDILEGEMTNNPVAILCSASKRWFTYKNITATKFIAANYAVTKRIILTERHKVKHWVIWCGGYEDAPDVQATWFVDPPYIGDAGTGYRFGSSELDYTELARWCQGRKGQVLVCEATDAVWLPFQPLRELVGVAGKRSGEALWTNSMERCRVDVMDGFV